MYFFNCTYNFVYLKNYGEADVSGEQLHEILREIDTNMNGQVELDEYLQVDDNEKPKHPNPCIILKNF